MKIKSYKPYMLSNAKLGVTRSGDSYGILTLVDENGSIPLNVWGMKSIPEVPCMVYAWNIKDNRGMLSCSLSSFEVLIDEVPDELMELCPQVVSRSDWNSMRDAIADMIVDSGLCSVWVEACDKLYQPYSEHIGGRTMHHTNKGGLLNHTYDILNMFVGLKPRLAFDVNPFIFAMGALFHDYYKMSEYDCNNSVTPQITLIGHPAGSYEAVGAFLRSKGLDTRMVMFVQHCVLSHHGKLEYGSPVLPCNQEAMLLSKLDEVSASGEAMSRTASGQKCKDVVVYHYED